jgi:hypothetical protein
VIIVVVFVVAAAGGGGGGGGGAVLIAVISFLLIRLVLLFKWPRIWNYDVITQMLIMLKCLQLINFKRSSKLRYRHTVVLYN